MAAHSQMSTESLTTAEPGAALSSRETSIVPADSIAGRALVAVIAIMTFLGALTIGGVVLVRAAAGEWQSAVAREVTIQVLPTGGHDIETEVKKAADIAAAALGVVGVRTYSKAESARLLEPWLGTSQGLDDLPVPRLIVVRVVSSPAPDLGALRKALADDVVGARLDDHRGWIDRMRTMTRTVVLGAIAILALVLAATVLSVAFATRGAMATNRPIIEVLHFVGAKDGFISGQFQRHFLLLGLKGGAIGGAVAMLLFAAASLLGDWYKGTASEEQVAALFGSFAIGAAGYAAIVGLVILIAVVTAVASRFTVYRTLGSID